MGTLSPADPRAVFDRVVLIEDDAGHAALLKRTLRSLVGSIHHVSTGSEAREYLTCNTVDLVLCDLQLRDETAVELIPTLLAICPNLPVIVLTSSSDLEHAVSAMRAGAWDFMVKQFTDELYDRFNAVLTRAAERHLALMRELRVQQERDAFWAAAQSAEDGVAILRRDGTVVFASDAFKRFYSKLTGLETFHQESFATRLSAHNPTVGREFQAHLLAAKESAFWSCEVELGSEKEGGKRPFFELTLSSVSSSVPGEEQLVLWTRDITVRKEQERFQRDLLSTTSHDLKGPLGAILNSAELIECSNTPGSGRSKDLITRIASCARSCISIIDEFLSARRIQDGVFVVKPLWLSTSDALSDIVLDYQPIARAKAIDLSFTVGSTKERVWADPLALKRILGNLVSNALKFTPKGGRVVVSAERFPEATRLSVSDSGVGIDAKDRHLLFERYSRLEKHQTVDGTGLGLFVTKHLVDAHSGRIEVKSEVGRGTQFTVWLPHAEGAPSGAAQVGGEASAAEANELQASEEKAGQEKGSHPGE